MMWYDTKGFFIEHFSSCYFQNELNKTTFLKHFLEMSLHYAPMLYIMFTSSKVTYNDYEEINTLYNIIGLKVIENLMFEDMKTWPFCYFKYALTTFSIKVSAVRSPPI